MSEVNCKNCGAKYRVVCYDGIRVVSCIAIGITCIRDIILKGNGYERFSYEKDLYQKVHMGRTN